MAKILTHPAAAAALLAALAVSAPATASAAPASASSAATSCYGGAVTVSYGDAVEFGPYTTTSRCTDINLRMVGGDAEFVWACVKFTRVGECNYWTKVGRSWKTIATDVKDGSKFTVPLGVDLEGSSAHVQIAF
ncbi:hypothetical protein GT030_15565 [Streptomyces sp. SID1328]|uniref:hypothetical protein n=1 Tax=Streptomyces sp. SID1328 TaxID=2690250 RepID=UPI00136D018F|nr:hypothetical protein [Streptomyces sp. SID1328]MYV38901.1 hypothetical protein [Streptomyces sp. SID1328]MYV40240.1 hypothetical protein [Streptomyces sp. SID1328]